MKFYHLTTEAEIRALIAYHNMKSEFCVYDFETDSKNPREAKLIDIQMSGYGEDEAVMFGAEFLPLLSDLTCAHVLHNHRYDWKVAYLHGVDLRGKLVRDTMLMHHLHDENAAHDLDTWVQEQYGDNYKSRFWAEHKTYPEATFEKRLDYGCRDVVYTGLLYHYLDHSLGAQRVPGTLVEHVHRLAAALLDTELSGIKVDLDYTMTMGAELKGDIVKTEREARELVKYECLALELQAWSKVIEKTYTPKGKKWQTLPKPEFNFAGSAQVASLLFDQLKLPPVFSKKTRSRTADDKALEALESQHPVIPKIRQLRKYSKMYGSFVEGVLERATGDRIYPEFNVNGTVTGRISHSNPNMGQMPSRGDWSKIRGIFTPDEGHKLITCDYGMLEVVVAAHYSQDKNLLKIIHEGASKHDITAEALGVPRSVAKTANFAAQYLCGPRKFSEVIGCSEKEGEFYLNKYWEAYSGEKVVVDECRTKVDKGEPIINPFGRMRRFPAMFEKKWERESAYRQAYSSLIQGTGGDLTSYAFYHIAELLKSTGMGRAWFTVHDEILVEAKTEHVEEVRAAVQKFMICAGEHIKLSVPLTVECSGGLDRWTK